MVKHNEIFTEFSVQTQLRGEIAVENMMQKAGGKGTRNVNNK